MATTTLSIPLRSGEVLQLRPGELSDEVINILKTEAPPLSTWLEFAKAFLAQGRDDTYANVLAAAVQGAARDAGCKEATFSRIQIMCSLAEFQTQKAREITDVAARGGAANAAFNTLLKARGLDGNEMLPALCIGHWYLSTGQLANARQEYEKASRLRCNGRPSIAGALALAALHFRQGAFPEALRLYRQALLRFPGAPPAVRLGIAACLIRMGDTTKAEAAYNRTLALNPGCTQALLGLAVLALSSPGDSGARRRGSQLLAQAFANDPDSPHTLVLLSHFTLCQGFADRAARLAQAALDRADEDESSLRAEALCLLARAHHAQGQVKEAFLCYQRAAALDATLPLVRLGTAQMSVLSGEHGAAAAQLEALLEDRPAWVDALEVLGPLLPRLPTARTGTRAGRHFTEAAERDPGRADLWEMLGDALAASDPAAALGAYQRAVDAHRRAANASASSAAPKENGHPAAAAAVPARLLNNAAVLQLRAGDASEALHLAAEALSSAGAGGLQSLGAQAQVTLGYNAARIREATGDLRAAAAEYSALLAQFPLYVDCHLRLGGIALGGGDLEGAERWARSAAEASNRSADSLALLASVHLARRDHEGARRLLEEMSAGAGAGQKESYAKLALANVHLAAVPGDQRQEEARRKAEAQLSHALGLYRRVLDKDEGNIYAANGVGCVLAESGHLAAAKEVLTRVQESAVGAEGQVRLPDAAVNLANVNLGLGQFAPAAQTYAATLQRCHHGNDARLALYLAKAQYEGGKAMDALRTLCKAAHLAPGDLRLRFNTAYVLQQHAERTVNKERPACDAGKAAELTEAVGHLAVAFRIFNALREAGPEASGIASKKLNDHIDFVAVTHERAVPKAEAARREVAAAAARREEQRLKMEAAARLRDVEVRRRAAEAAAAAAQREAVAQEASQKLERLKAEWRQGAVLAKAAEQGDAGMVAKASQQQQQRAEGGMADAMVDALFAVDDDEEDFEYVPGQEDSAGGGGEEMAPLEGAAALAAAGLASSDEDDDADFEPGADSEAEEAPAAADGGSGGKESGQQKQGRLKKRRRPSGAEAAAAGGLEDGGGGEVAAAGTGGAKRPRALAALEDSDEEERPAGKIAVAALESESD